MFSAQDSSGWEPCSQDHLRGAPDPARRAKQRRARIRESGRRYAAGLVYQITNYDNDGTHGVYVRPTLNLSPVIASSARYATYGTSVQLLCGTSGGAVGPHNNTAWDQVKVLTGANTGLGGYVSEHWLNTPVASNQHVAGESSCSSSTTTSTPAPTPSTSTQAQQATSWATRQLGSTPWNGLCLSFVRSAYLSAGVDLKSLVSVGWGGTTYPQDIWGHFKAGTTGTGTPPAGALVFYLAKPGRSRTYSHVTIAVDGGGNTISTTDTVNKSTVHREAISQHSSSGAWNYYAGWWLP